MKNPLTPAGIEPATDRFVAQHLNLCATLKMEEECSTQTSGHVTNVKAPKRM